MLFRGQSPRAGAVRGFVDQAVPLLRGRLAEARAIIEDYLDRERREVSWANVLGDDWTGPYGHASVEEESPAHG